MSAEKNTATCACSSVVLELTGPSAVVTVCHCDDCQKSSGAPFLHVAGFPLTNIKYVKGENNLNTYTLKKNPRNYCKTCSNLVVFRGPPGLGLVNARLLSTPLPAGSHIQCQFASVKVLDALPKFKDLPTAFGGSGETVEWK